jgi:transglutaminase-like putative cysteine protease
VSSAGAQVAVLGMRGERVPDRHADASAASPWLIRVATYAVLGAYGAARWSTLLAGGTHRRLGGMLGLGVLLVGLRPLIAERSRALAALLTAIVLVAAFPVAGLPLRWVLHLRIAVMANAIGEGLAALPQALVPYLGANQWVRLDIVLGGGVLLIVAALLLAFAPRGGIRDLRRAGAALALIALVAVPSTLAPPKYPYLEGLGLFLLLAAFLLGDRAPGARAASAVSLCLLAGVVGMLVAPGLEPHRPWINYESLANRLTPQALETFNWSQTYGPLDWPHRGQTVLEVRAQRPEYWKVEDLDVFDGHAWTQGIVPGQEDTPAPDARWRAAWSQTIQVTLRQMKSTDVVGAGTSSAPADLGEPVSAGFSAGTWTTAAPLQSGDSYTVRVYAPQPSAAQLQHAGSGGYDRLPGGYRTILLPRSAAQVVFPAFHSPGAVQNVTATTVLGGSLVRDSVYGGAYRLAQRLAEMAVTPYAFALAVERFLAHGFTYDQSPPVSADPLESFLFTDRRGYCQQFAGAMALLLRMGGVPARVAVGFTQGHQDAVTGSWLVSDLDAHAWVEVWFPHYGWVEFDPTPAADPALAGITSAGVGNPLAGSPRTVHASKRPDRAALQSSHALGVSGRGHRSDAGVAEIAGGTVAVLLLLGLLLVATRPLGSVGALVDELERGFSRSGRPAGAPATLAQLEERLRRSRQASEYIRVLRLARFADAQPLPTPAQRRALRRELAFGLGPLGRLWALWALPPRRRGRARATHAGVRPPA